MSLNNEIILKSLIGFGLFFFIIWLVLACILIFSGSAEFSVKGLGLSFLVLQIPTLVLVIKTKLRLSRSAIK
ncbi:hypothetical protein RA178_13040 [Shewanella oncorhynchi]|jgi:hypothetical protein|uniref:Uncharacterized protein n=1 Tax=Shewanella oncorhynchi TaxID=2726434 RepID=A0AA50Q4V0_9GAMM|nr:hypothetical protein [Shewanella oncorhynchi]WMB71363.1 hypothetical protein RA178_13040 [Shewanella oncorhynchi]